MLTRRSVLSGLGAALVPTSLWAQSLPGAQTVGAAGWPLGSLADAGLDQAAMAELVDMIEEGVTVPNVHALLVAHRDRLVFEHYWPGEDQTFGEDLGLVRHGPETLHDIRSVTKSIATLLLGIALGEEGTGLVHRPLPDILSSRNGFGAGWEGVTLHHVLTMTAGIGWNETLVPYTSPRNDFGRLMRASDPVGLVLGRDIEIEPGSQWVYNSGLTEVVAGVIETLTQTPLAQFAETALWRPLGIEEVRWLKPDAWPEGHFPSAGAALRMRAPDLAKIGALVLEGGQWQGQQIVPRTWIDAATTRHVQDNPWGPPGVYGYGYFWFPGTLLGGQKVIRASGWGDQRLYVLPDLGLSVTLLAGNYDRGTRNVGERIIGRIVRAAG